ncbi:toxin glutamine deamidase domain-containing protein, partial [Streptomyces sp. NPDC004610]|uniref:toxin glutamine deamidase domain-containing protein n=1 Tax=unclassified Streptomyces TaxID=2593676 RepID=UPI0033B6E21E
ERLTRALDINAEFLGSGLKNTLNDITTKLGLGAVLPVTRTTDTPPPGTSGTQAPTSAPSTRDTSGTRPTVLPSPHTTTPGTTWNNTLGSALDNAGNINWNTTWATPSDTTWATPQDLTLESRPFTVPGLRDLPDFADLTASPTPAPTPEPAPNPTREPTPNPDSTPEPSPHATASPIPIPTPSPIPTSSLTPTPISAPISTPISAPIPTPTPTPDPDLAAARQDQKLHTAVREAAADARAEYLAAHRLPPGTPVPLTWINCVILLQNFTQRLYAEAGLEAVLAAGLPLSLSLPLSPDRVPGGSGIRPAVTQDDIQIGSGRAAQRLALGPGWTTITSWKTVEDALTEAGPGSTALILTQSRIPDQEGHAQAAHRVGTSTSWIEMQGDGEPRIDPRPPAHQPTDTQAVIVGADGQVRPHALTEPAPDAPDPVVTDALTDPLPTTPYGALGFEAELMYELVSDRPLALKQILAEHLTARSLIVVEKAPFFRGGDNRLYSSHQAAAAALPHREPRAEEFMVPELVSAPLAVLPDEGGRPLEDGLRTHLRTRRLLEGADLAGTDVSLVALLADDPDWRVLPEAGSVLLRPSPVGAHHATSDQFTIGVPPAGLTPVLDVVRDRLADPRLRVLLAEGRAFADVVTARFAREALRQELAWPYYPFLPYLPGLAEVHGHAWLLFNHVAAPTLAERYFVGRLRKNLLPAASRNSFADLHAALSPEVRHFLRDNRASIISQFEGRLRTLVRNLSNRPDARDLDLRGLLDERHGTDERHPASTRDYLLTALLGASQSGAPVSQWEMVGMEDQPMDTVNRHFPYPLALLELRHYWARGDLRDPLTPDLHSDLALENSLRELGDAARHAHQQAGRHARVPLPAHTGTWTRLLSDPLVTRLARFFESVEGLAEPMGGGRARPVLSLGDRTALASAVSTARSGGAPLSPEVTDRLLTITGDLQRAASFGLPGADQALRDAHGVLETLGRGGPAQRLRGGSALHADESESDGDGDGDSGTGMDTGTDMHVDVDVDMDMDMDTGSDRHSMAAMAIAMDVDTDPQDTTGTPPPGTPAFDDRRLREAVRDASAAADEEFPPDTRTAPDGTLTPVNCVILLRRFTHHLYLGDTPGDTPGVFPRTGPTRARDDLALGTSRADWLLAPDAHWRPVGSWRDLTDAVRDGAPGTTALVLTLRTTRIGHAYAVTRTAEGLRWIEMQATGDSRITDRPPAGLPHLPGPESFGTDPLDIRPLHTRAVVLGPGGRVVPDALPASSAHRLVDALTDPPARRDYGGTGAEAEFPLPLGNLPADADFGTVLATHTSGATLVVDQGKYHRAGRKLYEDRRQARQAGHGRFEEVLLPIPELVTPALAVLDREREAGRLSAEEGIALYTRTRAALRQVTGAPEPVRLTRLLTRDEGWTVKPAARQVVVSPPPVGLDDLDYLQFTAGVPTEALTSLLDLALDHTGSDRHHEILSAGRDFADDLAVRYASAFTGLTVRAAQLPFLTGLPGLSALHGYAWLGFTQVAVLPVQSRLYPGTLLKGHLPAASRVPFADLLTTLDPIVRTFLSGDRGFITARFEARASRLLLDLRGPGSGRPGDGFADDPLRDRNDEGVTARAYLDTMLLGRARPDGPVGQNAALGVKDRALDTLGGVFEPGLPLVELRYFAPDPELRAHHRPWRMTENAAAVSFRQVQRTAADAHGLALRVRDPASVLTPDTARDLLEGNALVRRLERVFHRLEGLQAPGDGEIVPLLPTRDRDLLARTAVDHALGAPLSPDATATLRRLHTATRAALARIPSGDTPALNSARTEYRKATEALRVAVDTARLLRTPPTTDPTDRNTTAPARPDAPTPRRVRFAPDPTPAPTHAPAPNPDPQPQAQSQSQSRRPEPDPQPQPQPQPRRPEPDPQPQPDPSPTPTLTPYPPVDTTLLPRWQSRLQAARTWLGHLLPDTGRSWTARALEVMAGTHRPPPPDRADGQTPDEEAYRTLYDGFAALVAHELYQSPYDPRPPLVRAQELSLRLREEFRTGTSAYPDEGDTHGTPAPDPDPDPRPFSPEALSRSVARAAETAVREAGREVRTTVEVNCVVLVRHLLRQLYPAPPGTPLPGGARAGVVRDDLALGTAGPEQELAPGPGWAAVTSWRSLAERLERAEPGTTAVVLTRRTTEVGHAYAAQWTTGGLRWVEMQAGADSRVTEAPPVGRPHRPDPALIGVDALDVRPLDTRAVLIDPRGRVILPDSDGDRDGDGGRGTAVGYADALVDPPVRHDYAATSWEAELRFPLYRLPADASYKMTVAVHDTGVKITLDKESYYRVGNDHYESREAAREAAGRQGAIGKETVWIPELVMPPMATLPGDDGRMAPGTGLALHRHARMRLSLVGQHHHPVTLTSLLTRRDGWTVLEKFQDTTVGKPPRDNTDASYVQFTVGAPTAALTQVLDLTLLHHHNEFDPELFAAGRAFADRITAWYASTLVARTVEPAFLPYLRTLPGVAALHGYLWLAHSHLIAYPMNDVFFDRLTKNRLPAASRVSFADLLGTLPLAAQDFLDANRHDIATRFKSDLKRIASDYAHKIGQHRVRTERLLRATTAQGVTPDMYLRTVLLGSLRRGGPVTQDQAVGMRDYPLDTHGGRHAPGLALLELRYYDVDPELRHPGGDAMMTDRALEVSFHQINAVARSGYAWARSLDDPATALPVPAARAILDDAFADQIASVLDRTDTLTAERPDGGRRLMLAEDDRAALVRRVAAHATGAALDPAVPTALRELRERLTGADRSRAKGFRRGMPTDRAAFRRAADAVAVALRTLDARAHRPAPAPAPAPGPVSVRETTEALARLTVDPRSRPGPSVPAQPSRHPAATARDRAIERREPDFARARDFLGAMRPDDAALWRGLALRTMNGPHPLPQPGRAAPGSPAARYQRLHADLVDLVAHRVAAAYHRYLELAPQKGHDPRDHRTRKAAKEWGLAQGRELSDRLAAELRPPAPDPGVQSDVSRRVQATLTGGEPSPTALLFAQDPTSRTD